MSFSLIRDWNQRWGSRGLRSIWASGDSEISDAEAFFMAISEVQFSLLSLCCCILKTTFLKNGYFVGNVMPFFLFLKPQVKLLNLKCGSKVFDSLGIELNGEYCSRKEVGDVELVAKKGISSVIKLKEGQVLDVSFKMLVKVYHILGGEDDGVLDGESLEIFDMLHGVKAVVKVF
ncbi:hypothetical protein K503DRAFT_787939 [Rhizopogon vinicolor AM-OR11-026]|uniref:Uncharacterized protein n=1 Tax=Rhizopogon vinicolor AM-OR11-026 TaxID=1314800 RepID=A0A1B7MF98_9AGAM|nr:hypothetical protein K503DRAFT_787939 [Rhizopogon vinicolor AM-OR11-026]